MNVFPYSTVTPTITPPNLNQRFVSGLQTVAGAGVNGKQISES